MTKSQNREDLAEIKDDEIQNMEELIKELMAKDYKKLVERSPIKHEPYLDLIQDSKQPIDLFNNSQYLETSSRENKRAALIRND